MPVTIKDIARRLNVSISTVSYALNGGPRPVPPEVREKVLAVARELDYRPNSLARSMATGRTDTIAIIPPRGTHPMLLSPYIQVVLSGIIEAAEDEGQDVLLHTASEKEDPETIKRAILGGRSDGVLLIAPSVDSALAREIAARNFPCVVMSADGPEGTLTVTVDNHAATYQALDHLIALGHRHIGSVTGRLTMRDGLERRDAYLTYLREHDLPVHDEWIAPGDFSYWRSHESALQMLASTNRPTAILAGNDESGGGVMQAADELGLRVPEDLSVIAFDDIPESILGPRHLSSVRQPIRQMTARGVQLLVQWAREGVRPEPNRHIFSTELLVRRTTAPPQPRKP